MKKATGQLKGLRRENNEQGRRERENDQYPTINAQCSIDLCKFFEEAKDEQ
jgi:hypothetical protein